MPVLFDRCQDVLRRDEVAIFLFHGVIPEQVHRVRNYTRKHLPRADFEKALAALREHGRQFAIPEIVDMMAAGGKLPEYGYAITFDDGFENNLTVAAPVLRRYETPATFYVCSSFVDENRMSWTDQIESAFEAAASVDLRIDGMRLRKTLASDQEKIEALDVIRGYVKNNPDVEPYGFAAGIVAGAGGLPKDRDPWLDRKLTWKQVGELAHDPLFEVGAHGQSHRILSFLSAHELKREISESIGKLRDAIDQQVRHFSYPEGLAYCYSPEVIAELKAAGIVCSPTAVEGTNGPGTDPFLLRRTFVV
jgi:peptidoglycan/xylan/chitin deacetylase (PgdA/CDA1 family)